jgi:hypothetical protein
MAFPNNNVLSAGWNRAIESSTYVEIDPCNSLTLVASGLFKTDVTAATLTTSDVSGRPTFVVANSGSTATNVVNAQTVADSIIPTAGKEILFKGSFRMTTITQEFAMGFASSATNFINAAPSDYIGIQKLTTASNFSLITRKASGTAATVALLPTIAINTWYDWAIRIIMDPTVAGQGIVQVALASNTIPGNGISMVYNATVTNIPDTVVLRPFMAWRAGSAANVTGYFGKSAFSKQS